MNRFGDSRPGDKFPSVILASGSNVIGSVRIDGDGMPIKKYGWSIFFLMLTTIVTIYLLEFIVELCCGGVPISHAIPFISISLPTGIVPFSCLRHLARRF